MTENTENREFKPFDRILVRLNDTDPWRADFFRYYDAESELQFVGMTGAYKYCLLYEGNEDFEGDASPIEEPEVIKMWVTLCIM